MVAPVYEYGARSREVYFPASCGWYDLSLIHISNNTITALYEDEAGTLWVGTYKKGISFYNESIFKFGIADVGDIKCVEDGGGDIVWLGTNDRGLVRWNSVTDERMVFSHTADPHSISSDVIVCLLRDSSEMCIRDSRKAAL